MNWLCRFILMSFSIVFLVGCESSPFSRSNKEAETKLLIQTLLSDMPLPSGSSIRTNQTVILGSGGGWAGRIVVHAPQTRAQALLFFRDNALGTGWKLLSSTVSDSIILVFGKDKRYSTIEIFDRSGLSSGTRFTITVVPDVTNQQPIDGP
jgi:hypothetical protein